MPAVESLTSTQLNTVRSGGFGGECRIALCPNDVVFQAEITQTITSSVFAEFTWATTLQGAYTDCIAGMTVFITATSDPAELRRPLFRGRVRKVPTATSFYINESSLALQTGYVLTVIDTYEVWQRDRNGLLYIDWDVTFTKLLPIVKNMQTFYYGESPTSFPFSFAPTGQAMESGETISSYSWNIPGATYTSGSSSTQNVTVLVPYGHTWAHLTITDSEGNSNVFHFEILVCARDDAAFLFEAHDSIQINADLETGLNASTTYFAGVTGILNRTRCAVIAFDAYKAGSGTFNAIMFVGYLVNEDTGIAGDLVSSTLSQTRFELQSFAALAAQQFCPLLAIRNTAAPTAWDQINIPTPQRIVSYLITRYSTLGTLIALNFQVTDGTWYSGDNDLEGQTLLESINHVIEEINAALVFFPQGDARLEINANFLSSADRDALPDLILSGNITSDDLYSYALPLPYYKTIGQVEAGFASFQTSGADTVKLDGLAPASAWLEGNEKPVVLAQLLPADLTPTEAVTEAQRRIGDLLEFLQPPELINITLHDGWRFLTCSQQVWVTFDLAATDSTRGLAITSDMRYILQSLSFTWSLGGTWDVSGVARLETQGGNSQIAVNIAPTVIDTELPVLPGLSDYDSFLPSSTLNYLSDAPGDDEQPYGSGALAQFKPLTTEDAGDIGDENPGIDCAVIKPSLNFSSNATRTTPNVTVLNQPYIVTVKGSARISGSATYNDNMTSELGSMSFPLSATYPFGTWTSAGNPTRDGTDGGSWIATDGRTGGGSIQGMVVPTIISQAAVVIDLGAEYTVTAFSCYSKFKDAAPGATANWLSFWDDAKVMIPATETNIGGGGSLNTYGQATWSGSVAGVRYVAINITGNQAFGLSTAYLDDISVTYEGVGVDTYGDGFYTWTGAAAAELYPATRGLLLDSAQPSVPPAYNTNSEYVLLFNGTGNVISFLYSLADYSGAQNLPLYVAVCGAGMGS
jgi:hypothetical protein